MPAELIDDPLGIEFVSTARRTNATVYIGKTCNPLLAREMLIGLCNLVHPHGPIDELKTFQQYVTAIRRFVAELAERGHTGGAAELSRARLAEYWMSASNAREYKTRRMVAALDRETAVLRPDVRALVGGRHFNPQRRRDKRPLVPYTEGEWQRLQQVCRTIIRATFAEHRAALAAAERGRDPREHGWSFDNLCWLLGQHGPVTWTAFDREHGSAAGQACIKLLPKVCTALFVDTTVALAYRLLLGTYIGIVPDGIEALGVEDLDWAGDATILLGYLKGRTTTESVTLNRRSVRLLEQWLEHSSPTRNLAPPETRARLWTRYVPGRYDDVVTTAFTSGQVTEWAERGHPAVTDAGLALVADDGRPLRIDRRRIRTTFSSLRDRKSWFGSTRSTVDPNHTPAIEGDNYLTATTPAQRDAVETIIENSQADLLRKAQPPIVLSTESTAELVERFPDAIRAMELHDTAVTELVNTANRDVFVAACADQLSGLHGPVGKPCPARPWVCLLCPLAIFTPRHAVNLLRMQAFFARQWQQLPSAQFMVLFGPYAQRIDAILAAFRDRDPELLVRAARDVADTDAELPLLPEERTTS
ncbi:hypothetical protein [Amycolatopsis keratiniphila]|uniref:hypothetical protein n=1 Tax=Amycolatopsis keratiniphila TaxID=129921 RepID=UPI00087DB047|nr:hypothetical protein [Amycolatopsis keratiniphila]OLZ50291.1 hypothetical protein BS330_28935 [Amycolatopsis keratiniphila subsp. nogabecina]SDU67131.1 hypothetical protein SAMN04489733_8069 [Amycolatopsis keratiniphila]